MKNNLSENVIETLISFCNKKEIPFKRDIKLSTLCSFKIGGISPLIIEPIDNDQLSEVLHTFQKEGIAYKVLGGGTNLLISDTPDSFITLRLSGDFKELRGMEGGIFIIGASVNTTPIFRKISQMGYTGVEFMSTIPGWVGGAVIQNAGCYGGEIFNYIEEVEFIKDGKVCSLRKENIQYGYRNTQFLKNKDSIITKIKIKVEEGNPEEIELSLKDKRDKRNSSQPENKKSAGSVFKNPALKDEKGNPLKSWWLIDQVGLRGKMQGNAQISPEHCNFIVNIGEASANDVVYLINQIQEKVYSKFNIHLEREIEYFGEIS
jgi:UDP-N-acetylmuramate dehydrogenase